MNDNNNAKLTISNEIIISEIGNDNYVLNIETGKYLKLNNSSMFILNKIKDKKSEDEIVKLIIDEFKINYSQAVSDLKLFIEKATKLKIIKN